MTARKYLVSFLSVEEIQKTLNRICKIILVILSIAAVLLIINFRIILNIPLAISLRFQLADAEGLDITPVMKEITQIPAADERYRITTYDLDFISPWGKEKEIDNSLENILTFNFNNNKTIAIIKYEVTDIDYYQMKQILMTTPDDLKINKPKEEILSKGALLILKSEIPPSKEIWYTENAEFGSIVRVTEYDTDTRYWIELFPINSE